MALQSKQRWLLYTIALGLTLGAVFYGDDESGSMADAHAAVVQPTVTQEPSTASPVLVQAIPLDKLQRHSSAPPTIDPFSSRSWEQMDAEEARKNAPPEPPPRPQAPPLPYAYLGKMIEGDQTVVFLTARDRNYVARVGDTLDGVWQVVAIQDDTMSFDYVPLKLKQHLSFSSGGGSSRAMRAAKNRDEEEDEEEEKEE